jgi:AcrR family transcriptional regulator
MQLMIDLSMLTSMVVNKEPENSSDSQRRVVLLEAAVAVFKRFGYRKTSMDEVARAARVSRQGLYLHFANKEDLFRAAVLHALTRQMSAVTAVLSDASQPINTRLVAALDEWIGRQIGTLGVDATDLVETSGLLVNSLVPDYGRKFEQALADTISASPSLMKVYSASRLSPIHVAQTLHAAAVGFKEMSNSREAFLVSVSIAVQILLAPARDHASRAEKKRD